MLSFNHRVLVRKYKVWKLSNETGFLITKVFIFFKHQCYPLQNSFFEQLHTNKDIVSTFGSSAGSLQLVWYSACLLQSKKTSVFIFLTELPMSKISLVVWWQVMNYGFFNMILRPRGKVRRGTLWALLDQRKLEWANRISNQCWFFWQKANLLKGRHFGTLENIEKSLTDMLKIIPVEDFQRC